MIFRYLSTALLLTLISYGVSSQRVAAGQCNANFIDPTCAAQQSGYNDSGLFPVCDDYPSCGQGQGGDDGSVAPPVIANAVVVVEPEPDTGSGSGGGQADGEGGHDVEDCEPGFGVTCGDDVPPVDGQGDGATGDDNGTSDDAVGGDGSNGGFSTCFPLSCTDDDDTNNTGGTPSGGGDEGDCTPGFGVTCDGEGDATGDTGDDTNQDDDASGDSGDDAQTDDDGSGQVPPNVPTTGYCAGTPAGYECNPDNNMDSIYAQTADTLITIPPRQRLTYPFTTEDSTTASGVIRFKSIAQGGAGYQWRTWVSRTPGGPSISSSCEMESLPEDFFYWTQAGDPGYCDLGNTGGLHYFNFEVYCITPDASGNEVEACATTPLWPNFFIFEYRRQVFGQ